MLSTHCWSAIGPGTRQYLIYRSSFDISQRSLTNSRLLSYQRSTKQQNSYVTNNIRPKLAAWRLRYNDLRITMSQYARQFSFHAAVFKSSIREANRKIAEQEKDNADTRLNYNNDVETSQKIEGLPSERELHRKRWSRKLGFYMDSLQETLFTATRALNDVTGYSGIQRLKNTIEIIEKQLDIAKGNVKQYKLQYEKAIDTRNKSQREINELLQRKSSWNPKDVERFTSLYMNESINSKKEEQLKEQLVTAEKREDQLSDDLYRAILTRYHEEQIWSDKIRRTSTWGTLVLMGVNICLVIVFQLLLEPWRRKRLTRSFEDKVRIALDQYDTRRDAAVPLHHFNNGSVDQEGGDALPSEKAVLASRNFVTKIKMIMKNLYQKLYDGFRLKSSVTFSGAEFFVYSAFLLGFGRIVAFII
ncbi:hypothetical protein KAFR_0E03590 [Kazachstania africana CBS 2517]|uniref:Sensitive to high expression protein 9, mitochondrial n=1 Tax=Kazachstania africana (strain ATCC 22294 / BCRC 22015 / CBS 2517 / CECT 1963 / NBRC 1671 / NRRL Y-8276) TaxID=1071382 RepID=H2AVW0_KAZAF|nr:hypothetical protein KAFR_0E03590 [Kazachstania africana CBS 2517]CCF58510.1 hypothetical protein KAFR_0E03590 [Kazachstania africana CBS 2517]